MATKFDKMGKERFRELIDSSNSIREILLKADYAVASANYGAFHKAVKKYKIDTSGLKERTEKARAKNISNKRRVSLDDVMIKNSTYGTNHLRRRLIDEGILEDECSICGLTEWMGKEITLHLDHINGNSRDHRLENLRLLCPNCHSQTETYAGRNSRITYNCLDCGVEVSEKGRRCQSCANLHYYDTPWPDDPSIVLDDVKSTNFCAAGRKYGVSDNAVRKYLRRHNLIEDL